MADTARDRACEWLAGRLDSADEDDIPTITDRVLDGCYIAERWGVRYDADPRVHRLGQDITRRWFCRRQVRHRPPRTPPCESTSPLHSRPPGRTPSQRAPACILSRRTTCSREGSQDLRSQTAPKIGHRKREGYVRELGRSL